MRRTRFTISFLLVLLALFHLYIGFRIVPMLPGGDWVRVVAASVLVLSFVLVPLGLASRFLHFGRYADQIAWAGFLAMGLYSSLLVLTAIRDIAVVIASLTERFLSVSIPDSILFVDSAIAVVAGAVFMTVAGLFGARRTAPIIDVTVPIDGLPDALVGFTIVQLSDIHVGPTIKRRYLQAIVDRANAAGGDIIAITGDIIDGTVADLAFQTAPLAQLSAPGGVFAVTGNHEYYSGVHAWIDEFERLGLRVLMNEHTIVAKNGAKLLLAGVPDFSAHHFDEEHRSDPARAMRTLRAGGVVKESEEPESPVPSERMPRILMAHQPRSADSARDAGFDLQLSGHTHGGQFFPWNFFVVLQQPYVAGLHRHDSLWVYTSRGTGYWGPPKRFLAPSEITRIHLVKAAPR